MKRYSICCLLFCINYLCASACTNFMAGKLATTDGSILVSYAADSYSLYGFLRYSPATDYEAGAMRNITDWDTGRPLGQIPQVPHTYSVIGNMNEHQLVIGETTYGGREELYGENGIDYGSLIYIALERCQTAREAIQCITSLVEEYGYASEGESFTIADTEEVWILELIGKGKTEKGAVWVAQRIPDDCVSAHANQARITHIDFKDKKHKNFYWSKDVVSFARQKGWFDGKDAEFSFSDTYNPLDIVGLYICEARVWSFFRQVNKEMENYYSYVIGQTKERMPLYIKPDKLLSADDFKHFMRDHYENTPLDITQGSAAGPWHSKLRYGSLGYQLDSLQYWYQRPTATQQTGWSFVAQIRPNDPHAGIFWFGVDDAATTVYAPFYSNVQAVPESMREGNGDLYTYSATSAWWTFNKVANWAYSKYSAMRPDIMRIQTQWEQYFTEKLVPETDAAMVRMNNEEAAHYATNLCCKKADELTQSWNQLFEYLLVKYLDGQERKETAEPADGKTFFQRNEWGEPVGPNRPAFPEDFLRRIAPETLHE